MRVTRKRIGIPMLFAMLLAGLVSAIGVSESGAQTVAVTPAAANVKPQIYATLYMTNLTQQNDLNDIQTTMRNMLPLAKIYGMPSQHSISLWATEEDVATARRILTDLDKKKGTYRVTYTLTDLEAGKRVGTRHLALVVVPGERTYLKQGSRVPIVTGATEGKESATSTQVQYLDVGLNVEAYLEGMHDSVRLRTKIEQSSLADEKSGLGTQDPMIRQATLEVTSTLTPGKAMVLGTMEVPADAPGGLRKQEVEVVAELVP